MASLIGDYASGLGTLGSAFTITSAGTSAITSNAIYIDGSQYQALLGQYTQQQAAPVQAVKATPALHADVAWLRGRIDEICWH